MAKNTIKITKRDGTQEEFQVEKAVRAVEKAFKAVGEEFLPNVEKGIRNIFVDLEEGITVENVQDKLEQLLFYYGYFQVAKAFILYREKHKEARFIRERIEYMNKYAVPNTNAATASETDANANVTMKNVANLEGEVYKTTNRIIQRQRMKEKLNILYPNENLGKQYVEDLEHHIIYTHDEASTPVLKPYCKAVTLYPLLAEGVGNIDGVTPSAPNDIQSFSGQVTNLVFLLSSQCKGAVALGDYFIALNFYVIKEFGEDWYQNIDLVVTNDNSLKTHTVEYYIKKGMKQFIYGINQPAGNRSYNSPFTNVSYYDKYYFESLFDGFYYPDGTQPKWEAIDKLQRMFMQLHRELRLIKPLTFPVSTIALVHNNKEYLDQDYKELAAEEWAKGGSFFCYNSDNPASLSSCCRVLNEISDNTFSSTTGMTGIMTGSCNVITLNINRITQDYFKTIDTNYFGASGVLYQDITEEDMQGFKEYLIKILERVYKYHIAYKTMLYDMEDAGMFSDCNAGYIYIKKLYSTIGLLGYVEAAKYLGLEISNNSHYKRFLQLVFDTIKEQNKLHSIKNKKRPYLFNSEAVPGENLAVKLYNWDKQEGYKVPENQNLYDCYFFNPWNDTSVLDKFKLHGKEIAKYCDGGQAAHINLDSHLSKEQYLKLLDFAREQGTNYFTFNIPISECKDCSHVVNAPIKECPKCHSANIDYWTRIIGYLRPVSAFSTPRQVEVDKRVYSDEIH